MLIIGLFLLYVCIKAFPFFSFLPDLPINWDINWYIFSWDLKSGTNVPKSAFITIASVIFFISRPFAIICVPKRICASLLIKLLSILFCLFIDLAESESIRKIENLGKYSFKANSICSVPYPKYCIFLLKSKES